MLDGVPAPARPPQQVEAALRAAGGAGGARGRERGRTQRVKTQWVASEVYKLDSVFSQARELGSNWVQGLPLDASERLIAQLRAVTAEQVQAVAAKYFGDDQITVATLLPQPLDPNRKPRQPAPASGDCIEPHLNRAN